MKSSMTATSYCASLSGPSSELPYTMRTRATIGSGNATPRNDSPSLETGTGYFPSELSSASKNSKSADCSLSTSV